MRNLITIFVTLLSNLPLFLALSTQYVITQDSQGNVIYLADSRKPALYTGNFGACLESGSVNMNRFDAAFYRDNMTILFHLSGGTALKNESLMMSIDFYAYGRSRFNLTFDPCNANIASLCPLNASVPIEADGLIPVSPSDVFGIPTIAFKMPDFAGQATMRIFANSTQSEIGCYTAIVTNGNSFSQPAILGSVLGIFTAIAVLASFVTTMHGDNITAMQRHHTNSLSVTVIFATFQHIFYTGMISLDWPHVLVAWWSNFAWAGGMIYTEWMQISITRLTGSETGRKLELETARSASSNPSFGGASSAASIYALPTHDRGLLERSNYVTSIAHQPLKRGLENAAGGYKWYGKAVRQGLPLPGDHSGFAGALAEENIPTSNAFLTGLLWLVILIGFIIGTLVLLKLLLEGLSRSKLMKQDRLSCFRAHWLGFIAHAVLRILFIAFFMVALLTQFQFSHGGPAVVLALAALAFVVFCVSMLSVAAFAYYHRISVSNIISTTHRLMGNAFKAVNYLTCGKFCSHEQSEEHERRTSTGALPLCNVSHTSSNTVTSAPGEKEFLEKFYWLAGRFRPSRWWFFGPWLLYQFLQSCFYGGAGASSLVQVFGLLVLEILSLIVLLVLKPFQRQHLNALMMYLLGFSKVITIALCIAFNTRFQLDYTIGTIIGIVIIAIQGCLVICLLLAIALSATMSYLSLTRDYVTAGSSSSWSGLYRERHTKYVQDAANKYSSTSSSSQRLQSKEWKEPYFNVNSVHRIAKIEDEYPDNMYNFSNLSLNRSLSGDDPYAPSLIETGDPDAITPLSASARPPSSPHSVCRQAGSDGKLNANICMSYTSLPRAARVHRVGWSSHESLGTRIGRLSTHSGSLSPLSAGYSYAGVYMRGSDVRQATSPTTNMEHPEWTSAKHEERSDLEDMTVVSQTEEAALAGLKSFGKDDLVSCVGPGTVTKATEDFGGEKKPICGPENEVMRVTKAGMEDSKDLGHKNENEDENEDTINGTTLFEDSSAGNTRRNEDEALNETYGLGNSTNPDTLPTPLPTEHERRVGMNDERGQKEDQVQRLRDIPDCPHQICRLSLGDTFALDVLFPPGSPLRGDAVRSEQSQHTPGLESAGRRSWL